MDFTPYIQEGHGFSISTDSAKLTLRDGTSHDCIVQIFSTNGGRVIAVDDEIIEFPPLTFDTDKANP